mmetsp:Transcript_5675/g.18555  ORF Transcript_5675/g.18555 Transcript_5675/m.18555 type:complete len:220 (-) Transcript_5675:8-667(-)
MRRRAHAVARGTPVGIGGGHRPHRSAHVLPTGARASGRRLLALLRRPLRRSSVRSRRRGEGASRPAPPRAAVVDRLLPLAELPRGWDGGGGRSTDARRLLAHLRDLLPVLVLLSFRHLLGQDPRAAQDGLGQPLRGDVERADLGSEPEGCQQRGSQAGRVRAECHRAVGITQTRRASRSPSQRWEMSDRRSACGHASKPDMSVLSECVNYFSFANDVVC